MVGRRARRPKNSSPQAAETSASEEGNSSPPSEEPAGSGVANLSAPSQPTYVRITIRNGNDDGDPGAIAEAWFTIEDGLVVLRDSDDKVTRPELC
jgi:hypothetical protein